MGRQGGREVRAGGWPDWRSGWVGRRCPVTRTPRTLTLLLDHALQYWRDVVARIDQPVLMVAARESHLWP